MHFREKKSVREIVRLTSLSRNTVRKWLKAPVLEEPKYRRSGTPRKLTPFVETLKLALKADAHRPRHERRSTRALFKEIGAQGYAGTYSSLTDFVRAWRHGEGQSISAKAFVPLAFELGEAFQFDWSEEGLVVGGIYYRMQVSHLKLCASRAFWLVAYPSQGHEMLFDAHTRSFAAMGGIARRGIYDLRVDGRGSGQEGQGPHRQQTFRRHVRALPVRRRLLQCGFELGEGRGGEERAGQSAARTRRGPFVALWIEAGKVKFGSFIELNAWLGDRCRALWDEVRHPEHHRFSVAEMLDNERPHLMPMPEPFDGYVHNPARVSSTCLVVVARNRYSVPCELAGHVISTRLYPGKIVMVADDAVVAIHERLSDRGQTQYNWQHYIPLIQRKPGALRNGAPFVDMPEPLLQLRRALLRDPGGDRVMAKVLAIVPTAGLDAVLVAVELALESTRQGRVSVEHVLNVLARLNSVPVPESAATSLQVAIKPLANTERYDSLRSSVTANATTKEADHA